MSQTTVLQTSLPKHSKRQGKVRDVYDLGDRLLLVATDRISAFDCIMPNGIPDKGRLLTGLSLFWFDLIKDTVDNHLISVARNDLKAIVGTAIDQFDGRSMIVRKAEVVPVECVVRGYLAGSGWKDYQAGRPVSGVKLPAGLKQCSKLQEPIFTPSTKATEGHDEPVSFGEVCDQVGKDLATQLRDLSVGVYVQAREYALKHGIIIADTKFEWGLVDGKLILVDEVLTPDSSRFWPLDEYAEGRDQPSFDKQFVRNYLETLDWDKTPPAPALPPDIVEKTRARYLEAYERITRKTFV
ncbi:MAG: phosphoribosylaminoimidazolesuccinocarboxamide synthase [Planctomycetes bacterium]|nr:phosphoribosylaminoimidazolesuccinocarboxamide synthase [Planctomycetota bacterium]